MQCAATLATAAAMRYESGHRHADSGTYLAQALQYVREKLQESLVTSPPTDIEPDAGDDAARNKWHE